MSKHPNFSHPRGGSGRQGKQPGTRHGRQLLQDMHYFDERGLLVTDTQWEETAAQALWQSQTWRTQPEFSGLAFDPYDSGRALEWAIAEMEYDPDAVEKLPPDDQELEQVKLHGLALETLLTAKFKQDFFRRLDRFRQRLRVARAEERLAQAALVQSILEPDDTPSDVWVSCLLLYQTLGAALDRYWELEDAADAIFDQFELNGGINSADPFADMNEQQLQELQRAIDRTSGLREFMERRLAGDIEDGLWALSQGQLYLNLFTPEELESFGQVFVKNLRAQGIDLGATRPRDLSPGKRNRIFRGLFTAASQWLDKLETPERRAALDARAQQQLQAISEEDTDLGTLAAVLLGIFEDEAEYSLGDCSIYTNALQGELNYYLDQSPSDEADFDEPLDDDEDSKA